ncbi:MAG: hypothetical protein IT581_14350 [Verrucomicrobiales bacterium]|nr:hypothetical protein [Verrucomicrobiales bacterium]
MSSLTYNCPLCGGAAEVEQQHFGGNVTCPHCAQEFFATPPDPSPPRIQEAPKGPVPFFKSSRLKLLQEKLADLTADGDFSADDARVLFHEAMRLRLSEKDVESIRKKAVANALAAVKARAEATWHLTEADEARIAEVSKAFDIRISIDPVLERFREIYRLEVKGEMPPPLASAPILTEPNESVYHEIKTSWWQMRVQRKGYAGTSVSIPSGIRGVRFRFGDITPISREEMTELANGTLYVTNRRLVFDGDRRNTGIKLAKILDLTVYKDGLEVDKQTGRSDFFSMNAFEARFIEAIVRTLRN